MKQVKITDEHGFERPMPAVAMLIPTGWRFQGNILWGQISGCNTDLVRASFSATGSDGRVAMDGFPWFSWQWADDPMMQRSLAASNQQMMAFGRKSCDVMPPMSAADLLRQRVLPKYRPGRQVVAIEPMPDAARELMEGARKTEAQYASAGMPIRVRADVARARLQYSLNSQPVEEWVMAASVCTARSMPSTAALMGQMGPRTSNFYDCQAMMLFSLRTPQGHLQENDRLFTVMRSTIRLEPEWLNRVTQVALNIAATEQKGAADRSAIIRKSGQDINRIITQGYEQRSKVRDQMAEQFDQTIRGVQTYRNPSTGETFELSNQYNHAWMNGLNEYILTDNPNFNPNGRVGGNWTSLEPVKPH